VLDQHAVVAAELVAPIVVDASLLGQARGRLERAGVGPEPEVATADLDRAPVGRAADRPAD
jgi:hypothetical protein